MIDTVFDPNEEQKRLGDIVKYSAEKNRQFFVVYLGLLVYVLLMVVSTTDQQLLVPSQGIKLPLVDVTLPLFAFYIVAPLFLLAIHFNLLQNLDSHHYKLMRWKEFFPSKRIPREEIEAFLFDHKWLDHASLMKWWVEKVYVLLFIHSGPIALGILLWRFTDYQSIGITSWHLVIFILDCYLVWLTEKALKLNLYRRRRLRNRLNRRFSLKVITQYFKDVFVSILRLPVSWLVVFQILILSWFHWGGDFVGDWQCVNIQTTESCEGSDRVAKYVLRLRKEAPIVFSWFAPIIMIDSNESAWVPNKEQITALSLLDGEDSIRWWKEHGNGLDLSNRYLKGAVLSRAFLPKAEFTYAHLEVADLSGARLTGANLTLANLDGASLAGAKLQGASMDRAFLRDALLFGAQMQNASLSYAKMEGARLTGANLQDAFLEGSHFEGADLTNANLQIANLMMANFQGTVLMNSGLQGAYMPLVVNQIANKQFMGAIFDRTKFWGGNQHQEIGGAYARRFPPFMLVEPDWKGLKSLIPDSKYPLSDIAQYLTSDRRTVSGSAEELKKLFPNKPELTWTELIPQWDKNDQMSPKDKLAAARGLLRNYETWFDSKKSYQGYFGKINQAFCASKNFRSLGENCSKTASK